MAEIRPPEHFHFPLSPSTNPCGQSWWALHRRTGQAVSFNGSGSSDPDGDALTYSWNFGDSTRARAQPTIPMQQPGPSPYLNVNDEKADQTPNKPPPPSALPQRTCLDPSYKWPAPASRAIPMKPNHADQPAHEMGRPRRNSPTSGGKELGKAKGGINTFCTYAMSSKAACFTCHIRTEAMRRMHPRQ